MIKYLGDKTTAKQLAQDVLMDKISTALGYWEEGHDTSDMTERELEECRRQMKKQADRVAKMFGFDEAWYS